MRRCASAHRRPAANAAAHVFEGKNYIGGQWRSAGSGRTFEQRNPAALADVTGTFAESGAEDADAAIAAARAAFPEWRALSPQARKRFLE